VELLEEIQTELNESNATSDDISNFFNNAVDTLGNCALAVASMYGSIEVVDALLDLDSFEVDIENRRDGDAALHKAVSYINKQKPSEWETVNGLVYMLLDAGCPPT